MEGCQSKTLQLALSSALAIHLPESFVHPHSIKLTAARTETSPPNISSLCVSVALFPWQTDLWLELMLPFHGAPFDGHYALRFFCLIIIIYSFAFQTKHVQPL